MNRVRLAFTGLMHRLGFVPTELLDRADARSTALQRRVYDLDHRLDMATRHVRKLQNEMREVYSLRSNVQSLFDIRVTTRPDHQVALDVLDVRIEPRCHSIRFLVSDLRLMRARPEDFASVWAADIARQLEKQIKEPLLRAMSRI